MEKLSLYSSKPASLKSQQILKNPSLFNSEEITTTPVALDISKATFIDHENNLDSIKSFKKISIHKNKLTGSVKSSVNTLNVIERNGTSFLTLRNLDLTRIESITSKSISSVKLKIDKNKKAHLPFLISALLDRNLLQVA